jgi:hypothetical protein
VTTYKAGQSFSELPGDRHGVSANASKTKPAKLLRGVRGGHERDGTDDPIRELRINTFVRRYKHPKLAGGRPWLMLLRCMSPVMARCCLDPAGP